MRQQLSYSESYKALIESRLMRASESKTRDEAREDRLVLSSPSWQSSGPSQAEFTSLNAAANPKPHIKMKSLEKNSSKNYKAHPCIPFKLPCTVGHKIHNPSLHVFLIEAEVMTFVAHCTFVVFEMKTWVQCGKYCELSLTFHYLTTCKTFLTSVYRSDCLHYRVQNRLQKMTRFEIKVF